MRKLEKVLVFLLFTVMVFAAYGGGQRSSASGSNEHLKISIMVASTNPNVNEDRWARIWNDKFNFEWEVILVSENQAHEQLRIWASAGDLPDVSGSSTYYQSEISSWAEQGMMYKLPNNWRTKWPTVAKTQEYTLTNTHVENLLGGTYLLLQPLFFNNKPVERLINHWGFWYRSDWARVVGMEVKPYMKTTELMELARRIKNQDPGKVGSGLIPMSIPTTHLALIFVAPNSLYSVDWAQFYKDASGQYQWGPAHPNTLTGLKLWRQAYDEGLLHREFYTLPTGRENEADLNSKGIAAINVAAGMASVASRYATFMRANLAGVEPNNDLGFAFVLNEDGKANTTEIVNWYGFKMFNPKIPQNKFERVMDIFEFAATAEGENLIRLGIEGEDWKRESNGQIVSLLPDDMQVTQKYFSIQPLYTSLLVRPDDFGLVNPIFAQRWKDLARNNYVLKTQMTDKDHFAPLDYDSYFYSSPAMARTTMNLPDEYAAIVLKGPNVEANFNAWVREKMPLIQPALNELNALKK
jgi:putative aldouronate transport system substrate-binding protein